MAPIAVEPFPVAATPTAKSVASINAKGTAMDAISDMVDEVNVYRGTHPDAPQPAAADDEAWRSEGSRFDSEKDKTDFRRYEDAMDHVKQFYKTQHEKQTVAFNIEARQRFLHNHHAEMTVWEAIEKLDTLVDESDPDTSLSPDPAPSANCRSNAKRRQARLDAAHRSHPRPRQAAVLLWRRWAMGRCW